MNYFLKTPALAFLIFGLFISGVPVIAQDISLGVAFNLADRQQMLVERVVAEYLHAGMNSANQARSEQQLTIATAQFEENLRLLQSFSPTQDIRKQIDAQDAAWSKLQEALGQERTPANLAALLATQEATLKACTQGVESIKRYAIAQGGGGQAAEWLDMVAVAGYQRMLLQRMYMLITFKRYLKNDEQVAALQTITQTQLKQSTLKLMTYESNPDGTDDLIVEFLKIWNRSRHMYDSIDDESVLALQQATASMCNLMERMATMYASR